MQLWLAAVLAAGVLAVPADVLPAASTLPATATVSAVPAASGRQGDFAAASREYGVPESVLLAVSYLESRWDANGDGPARRAGTARCTWWTPSPPTRSGTTTPSSGTPWEILGATTPVRCPRRASRR
ncbi:hypothetical protein ACFQYP_08185 [Nonomuraea antimicrobica]